MDAKDDMYNEFRNKAAKHSMSKAEKNIWKISGARVEYGSRAFFSRDSPPATVPRTTGTLYFPYNFQPPNALRSRFICFALRLLSTYLAATGSLLLDSSGLARTSTCILSACPFCARDTFTWRGTFIRTYMHFHLLPPPFVFLYNAQLQSHAFQLRCKGKSRQILSFETKNISFNHPF